MTRWRCGAEAVAAGSARPGASGRGAVKTPASAVAAGRWKESFLLLAGSGGRTGARVKAD